MHLEALDNSKPWLIQRGQRLEENLGGCCEL